MFLGWQSSTIKKRSGPPKIDSTGKLKRKKIKQEKIFPNTSKAKNTLDLLSFIKENGRYNDRGLQQQETMSVKENKDDRDDNNSVEPDDDIANEKDNERDISITPNILVRNNIC